jgi:hypothetical protein
LTGWRRGLLLNGDQIDCEEISIRLIGRRKDVLPGGAAAPEAFILRLSDRGRLSVFRKAISDLPACRLALNKLYGAATLHTGRVRAVTYSDQGRLDVVDAEGDGTEILGHAAIIGLPDPETEYEMAEHVASLLQRQSRGAVIS